ncbi:hypothetical protein FHR99_003192 [Litorivivens lipolytica]|uniref:Uncharacterized protein n=1 Tax=Litorivivens lipolytica TaxID=1524264 RepID=A0A7W4Z752_9GAMM|nr:hypothetical protein [Litorivivens lipolytica]MBB3048918.1 hypothetical protein [Litorivivens lipolytica]
MLTPLLRTGAFYLIWRRYLRPRFRGALFATTAILAINLVHHEALAFFRETGHTEYAAYSFYARWALWFLVAINYFVFVEHSLRRNAAPEQSQRKPPARTKLPEQPEQIDPLDDGFDDVRHLPRVRTRTEMILEAKKDG